jgi:ankyrin repeat protein
VLYNHKEITVLPIEADKYGWNALHHAAAVATYGASDLVISLIAKYPDMANTKTTDGLNIWHLAAQNNRKETLEALYNREEINVLPTDVDDNGLNALHHAVAYGGSDLVSSLIAKHPDMANVKTTAGLNIWHLAAKSNRQEILETLYDPFYDRPGIKVSPTETDNNGWNALHYAVAQAPTDCAISLIDWHPEMIKSRTNAGKDIIDLAPAATRKILLDLPAVKSAFNMV